MNSKEVKTEDMEEITTSKMNPTKVKKERMEEDETSTDDHLHRFYVKFGSDHQKYTIDCKKPGTVVEVIKSKHFTKYENEIKKPGGTKRSEENLVINVGEGNDSYIVATHFPCSCLEQEECLTITSSNNVIEKKQLQDMVLPREKYSIFFIDKEGGKDTKSKTTKIFRCNNIRQQFRYFCVIGRKEETVEEALRRDGRFVDLTDFMLSDNETGNRTNCTEIVDNLYMRKFQICLPRKGKTEATNPSQMVQEQDSTQQTSHEQQQEENASASTKVQKTSETVNVLEYAGQKGTSIKAAAEELKIQIDLNEIKDLLQKQFPKLKALMESRFPGRSFEKTLKLKRENFGKIQNSFSEVHRIEKLIKMGKSVCKVVVSNVSQGTGFVLFDMFILTSAHLFTGCVKGKKLLDHIDAYALFNYDKPEPETNYFQFSAEKTFIDIDFDLDFAVLQLKPDGKKPNSKSRPDNVKVPAGLLNRFVPLPGSGEACLIGHPAGSVKKMDPTCIIEPEKREKAVEDQLAPYESTMFTIMSIIEKIKSQGIESIMVGGIKADEVETYNTFMYHGASGSPVFDAHGWIFGIHTAGCTYGFQGHETSVIEYAHSVLKIFEKFVINLKECRNDQMLKKVKEAVTENEYLKKILKVKLKEVD